MNTAADLTPYQAMIEQTQPPVTGLSWLDAQRVDAAGRFAERGFPTRKDEAWRYTSLESLLAREYSCPQKDTPPAPAAEDVNDLFIGPDGSPRLVFSDGYYNAALSNLCALPDGVEVMSLQAALESRPDQVRKWLGRTKIQNATRFPALNTAMLQDGLYVHIPPGVSVEQPIEVLHLTRSRQGAAAVCPRNLIVLAESAQATLIEHYASSTTASHFMNAVTEVILDEGARLAHYRLQNESLDAFHISHVYFQQAGSSDYQGLNISLGGQMSRTEYHSDFQAQGAACNLDGLYLAGDKQVTDVHLFIDHALPECQSQHRFKGILFGKGRAVFDGLIRVERDAQKTAAHLSNDNLMLSRDAEVDTKPQLEIFADDVQCSHGTTVGELDPEQLYYLRSRGIARDQAYRMLCLGFAAETLDNCQLPAFAERVAGEIARRLQTTERQAAS